MTPGELCYLTMTCVSAGDRKQVFLAGTRFRFVGTIDALKEVSGGRVTASDEVLTTPLAVCHPIDDRAKLRLLFPLSALSPVRRDVGHRNGTLTK